MEYRVLRAIPGLPHATGELVDGDRFRNLDALVGQRFLKPLGDGERIAALEARVTDLEAVLKGGSKVKH